LAQLIYDLKQINPRCKVTVKLVAASGVGTIAAGVAKAKADVILISGHNGGTGASPATSIKYAGLPWEMGLTEAHQVLAMNNLRERITLRTDGGLRTGRDIVMAAMMGAEEYGIGTAALIAMGCILDEVIGRADLLTQVSRGSAHLDDLDLNPLLITVDGAHAINYDRTKYGATAGHLFAAGRAGERFAVRNSGASVVIEGCGTNGCEYMTGGVAVILGSIGANFGAGMTGGMAYLYDPEGKAPEQINMETVVTCPVTVDHWEAQLKGLVEAHVAETGSAKGAEILRDWDIEKSNFLQVCPIEMLNRIPVPLSYEDEAIPAE